MMNTEKRPNIKGKAVMCLLLVGLVTVAALIVALRVRIAPAKIISQPSDTEIMQEEVEAAVAPEQVGPTGNTDILLTELMSSNKSVYLAADGSFPDWLELTNTGTQSVNVGGYSLAESKGELGEWCLPERELAPGESLLVLCTGETGSADTGEVIAPFKLSSAGGQLFFADENGEWLWEISFPEGEKDQSICFDGEEQSVSSFPTPGLPNTDEGYEAYMNSAFSHGALVINEAVLYNNSYYAQKDVYYDWLELKNTSGEDILLSDYYICDKYGDEPYRLPEVTLGPGKLYVMFCSGDTSLSAVKTPHLPFKLSSSSEHVYLFNSDGTLSDRMNIHDITPYGSYGRMDGQKGFFCFEDPTPAKENADGKRMLAAIPVSDTEPGIYDEVEAVTVALSGEGDIYYTTDGSVPTEESTPYTEPIRLTQTAAIRAVSVAEGKLNSQPLTLNYIINEGHTLPVVSLVADNADLFSGRGIYKKTFLDFAIDANVSFFGEEGSFVRDCSLKLHGATSREVWAKKSFKVIFSSRFGEDLDYDIFGTDENASFHSFILRGGDFAGLHILRDELVSEVALSLYDNSYALDTRYCQLYINGEYFGLYAIRDAYSVPFFADKTGTTEDKVVRSRAPARTGELKQFFEYIINNNMSNAEAYEYAESKLDMQSLARWMCIESYFNNLDIAGNVRYVRTDTTGDKWQLAVFDFDISQTNDYAGFGKVITDPDQIETVCNSLMRSEKFRQLLLDTAAELYEKGLNESFILETLRELVSQLPDDEIRRNCERWDDDSYETWLKKIEWYYTIFSPTRTQRWLDSLMRYTNSSSEVMAEKFSVYQAS